MTVCDKDDGGMLHTKDSQVLFSEVSLITYAFQLLNHYVDYELSRWRKKIKNIAASSESFLSIVTTGSYLEYSESYNDLISYADA